MATISATVNSTYMAYKSGISSSMLNSSSTAAWNPYSNETATASNSVLSGLIGIRSSKADMVKTYDAAAKTFNTEFSSSMNALKKSAAAVKGLDFSSVGKDAITTKTDEEGNKVTEYSDKLKDAIGAVKSLVSDYNDAIGFFNDNSEVSARVKNMANTFSDTTYRAGTLSKIGISVKSNGEMSVDEDKLAKAITENPGQVDAVLGRDGLSGKAEKHVAFAESQSSKLFPSVSATLGEDFRKSAVYSGQSLLRISSYASVGNLLNMLI